MFESWSKYNLIKTIRLNAIELPVKSGVRLYLHKGTSLLSAIFFLALLCLFTSAFFTSETHDFDLAFFCIFPLGIVYVFVELQAAVARIIMRHPVLILTEGKLYSPYHDTWYNLRDHVFEDVRGKYDGLNGTYYIKRASGTEVLSFKNWYLESEDDFKRLVRFEQSRVKPGC